MQGVRILVVDDNEAVLDVVREALAEEGLETISETSVAGAVRAAGKQVFDVVVTDLSLPDGSGVDVLRFLRECSPSTATVVITAFPDRDGARLAEDLEVASFVTKPFTVAQIKSAVQGALKRHEGRIQQQGAMTEVEQHNELGLVGVSAYMNQLRRQIALAASSSIPVLIQGGSGTGKEVIAHAIHNCSGRKAMKMVIVNCAAIPMHLEEAEFFGHARGAFTGAAHAREGIIATADKSTLFLDEVGDLSLGTQAKLLRVLENKEFQRLGETASRTVDLRIISATNQSLDEMTADGRFRKDLYYRLRGDTITTRPLCEHREDIPVLVRHFVGTSGGDLQVTAEALEYLVSLEWPGNVRELKHFVSLLCSAAAGSRRINMAVISMVMKGQVKQANRGGSYQAEKAVVLSKFERDYFERLLQKHCGNLNRAGKEACMDRSNLSKKLNALGIDADEYRKKVP